MTEGQKGRLLNALIQKPMTSLECINQLGILRTAAVVYDLKKLGWEITTATVKVKNRFKETCHVARYTLTNPVDFGEAKPDPIPDENAWDNAWADVMPVKEPTPCDPGHNPREVELIKQRMVLGKFDIHNEQHMAEAKAAGVDPFEILGLHPNQQALL